MEINDDIRAFLARGPVFVIATRNEHMRPAATEGRGILLSGSSRELCVGFSARLSPETLANLLANRQIAVSLCTPVDYRAVQLKGICSEVRSVSSADQAAIDDWFDKMRQSVWLEGMSVETATQISTEVTHVARFVIRDIFDQTPGRNAGGPIR